MDLDNLRDELSDLLASLTASLAQHLVNAPPFLNAQNYRLWAELKPLYGDTVDQARRLNAVFRTLRMEPRTRTYSINVARFYDTALVVLVPLLLVEKREQAAALTRAIDRAAGHPQVIAELSGILSDVQRNMATLDQCLVALQYVPAKAG